MSNGGWRLAVSGDCLNQDLQDYCGSGAYIVGEIALAS